MEKKTRFQNFISASDSYCQLEQWEPAPYIRRTFDVPFHAEQADLFVCTPGFYELYLNGERITKGEMAPYISNPDHICYYDCYDISQKLKPGKNAIGLILGNGFANQCVPGWEFEKSPFRAPLRVSVELKACSKNDMYFLESDERFTCHSSPVLFDMYRYGMHYDARLEIPDWSLPEFDDSDWNPVRIVEPPKGTLQPCQADPIRITAELCPVRLEKQENFHYLHRSTAPGAPVMPETYVKEAWLYDFGVSTAGICRLKIKGKQGQKITLRHGETLKDGKFNLNSIYSFKPDYNRYIHLFQTDTYVLKGGEEEVFVPFFTYHGFRYVLVEGITQEQATYDLLTYLTCNSDIRRRGFFSSSDETLNQLYDMGIRADLANFVYFPTDCPHREKNGWTGDASFSASQFLLNFDCAESLRVWMENIRAAQRESGMIPCIVPTGGWGYDWGNGPIEDSAIFNLPYYALKYDGRLDLFAENAEMIRKYLAYIADRRNERGLIACGLPDWCQPGKMLQEITTPLELSDSCTIYEMAQKSAMMFTQIGWNKDAAEAAKLAEELKQAIRKHLIDFSTMTVAGSCQTAQTLPLAMGIFEADEYQRAYQRLLDLIEEKGGFIDCGVVGLRYIFHVLFKNGDGSLAYHMITRKEAPSYGRMIQEGGTALFESLSENGWNESQNHHFFGDILNLFVSKLAGLVINPNMTDASEIRIRPYPIPEVNQACARFDSAWGSISVEWKRTETGICLTAEIPEGIHGEIITKQGPHKLSVGRITICDML